MIIVWFNGPSRQKLMNQFPLQQNEIGCNYIRRDRAVQHVCVFDKQIWPNIKFETDINYYTHHERAFWPWQTVHYDFAEATNSGMLALSVACKLTENKDHTIYVIGCDWGLNQESVYDYRYSLQRKYTHITKKAVDNMCAGVGNLRHPRKIIFVHNAKPDVRQPIISTDTFLNLILYK
jgi:hypothetical protein